MLLALALVLTAVAALLFDHHGSMLDDDRSGNQHHRRRRNDVNGRHRGARNKDRHVLGEGRTGKDEDGETDAAGESRH